MNFYVILTILTAIGFGIASPASEADSRRTADDYLKQMIAKAKKPTRTPQSLTASPILVRAVAQDLTSLKTSIFHTKIYIREGRYKSCSAIIHLYQDFATAYKDTSETLVKIAKSKPISAGFCKQTPNCALDIRASTIEFAREFGVPGFGKSDFMLPGVLRKKCGSRGGGQVGPQVGVATSTIILATAELAKAYGA